MEDSSNSQSLGLPGAAIVATAIGAVAVGAFAIGVLAIGRLAVRRVVIDSAKIKSFEIDDLVVKRVHAEGITVSDSLQLPASDVEGALS